jgi:hypothetical protein
MKLLLCLFFFSFVWDNYLNIFLNIIIYILVYSGYHIKAYVSDSRLYSLYENLLKKLLKKKNNNKKQKKTTFFFYSKSNKPSHFVQSLDMRTSILSLQKVIYILKQLIIRHGNCLQKYCNWERAFKINVKKAVTIIDINRPTHYYINNTMGII